MVANWSELPHDILLDIALKVDTVENYCSFFAVCRSWNHAAIDGKREWTAKVPYLLLTEHTIEDPDYPRKILNITNNKCVTLKVPEIFGARCWGSSLGWLVVIDRDLDIFLFNPVTKATLSLPSIKENIAKLTGNLTELISIVSILDTVDDGIVVVIHFRRYNCLGFVKPGNRTWDLKETRDVVHDVLLDDDKNLLVMYHNGELGCIDMKDWRDAQSLKLVDKYYLPSINEFTSIANRCHYKLYLVKSDGDILMVIRYKYPICDTFPRSYIMAECDFRLGRGGFGEVDDISDVDEAGDSKEDDIDGGDSEGDDSDGGNCEGDDSKGEGGDRKGDDMSKSYAYLRSIDFPVYKLDFKTKQWEKVKFLRDKVIFVGRHCSMSVNVSNTPNIKSNCIFYTDDEAEYWRNPSPKSGRDLGCFDMETEELSSIYDGEDLHSKFSVPLWFRPRFF